MKNNYAIECDCGFTWKKNPYQTDKDIIAMSDAHVKQKHPFFKIKKVTFTPNNQRIYGI